MAEWGDIVGSWQFIVDAVKYIWLIIEINIMVLLAGAFTYISYQLFEITGLVLTLSTRAVIKSVIAFKNKSWTSMLQDESTLLRSVRADPAMSAMWDLRSYLLRNYRVWQYSISFLMIGTFWIALIFLFIDALTQGGVMMGDVTLMEYGTEILKNVGNITTFAFGIIFMATIITGLMMGWRVWRWLVMDEKLFRNGNQSIADVIKGELGPLMKK